MNSQHSLITNEGVKPFLIINFQFKYYQNVCIAMAQIQKQTYLRE